METHYGIEARRFCVGYRDRKRHRRHRDAGGQVKAEVGETIAEEMGLSRRRPAQPIESPRRGRRFRIAPACCPIPLDS